MLKKIQSIIAIIAVVFSAFLFIDHRYTHAMDSKEQAASSEFRFLVIERSLLDGQIARVEEEIQADPDNRALKDKLEKLEEQKSLADTLYIEFMKERIKKKVGGD